MKILAFAGSNSSASINKKLVTHTATFFTEHSVELLDLNDYEMPLFSVDTLAKSGCFCRPKSGSQVLNWFDIQL